MKFKKNRVNSKEISIAGIKFQYQVEFGNSSNSQFLKHFPLFAILPFENVCKAAAYLGFLRLLTANRGKTLSSN